MVNYNSAYELIQLEHHSLNGVDYKPTLKSIDKRTPISGNTSINVWSIGSLQHNGITRGPVYRMIFADLSSVTAPNVIIWAIDNPDTDPVMLPVSYLMQNPVLDIMLYKFDFADAGGSIISPGGSYNIIGAKMRSMPL